ncbi:MAG: DICT sensory domain-containing protein [Halorientalis sp.]
MELREIVAGVEGTRPSLALCNVDASQQVLDAVGRYFEPRHVALRRTATDEGVPENVALLHEGEQFLAASALVDLYEFVDPAVGVSTATDIETVAVPDVVRALDDTTFSDYGKERMITASREIEKRAWKAGAGTVHAGFQRLSLVRSQRPVYRKLVDAGLDVHVYGVPDADPPSLGATAHGIDAEEIAESWFVVFDGDGVDEDKCALLARTAPETNTYRGFWTYRADVVDAILDRLHTAYLD